MGRRQCIVKSQFGIAPQRIFWYEDSEDGNPEMIDLYYTPTGSSSIETLPIYLVETVPDWMITFDEETGYPLFNGEYSAMAGNNYD